jgi:peptide/nickel transport system permease protein
VITYVLRRVMILPIVMFFVSVILFVLLLQLPVETRVQVYLPSTNRRLSDEEYERLVLRTIERYGLDRPAHIQYINWVQNLLRGEWGYSPTWHQPVLEGIRQRAPATIELGLFAMIPSIALALMFGRLAAKNQYRLWDYLIRGAASIGWAFPSFIFGLILLNVLYAWLGWFPPGRISVWASSIVNSGEFRSYTGFLSLDGILNGEFGVSVDAVRHLVLPGLTLAFFNWALFVRIMRVSLLEVLNQDYITTARSKGLRERAVINLHANRNAVLPLISSAGVAVSVFLSSVMIIELLFGFNGLGRWAMVAVQNFDVPVALGFVLASSLLAVSASLAADILYGIIDPRVRLE